jgi:hypothetical protein
MQPSQLISVVSSVFPQKGSQGGQVHCGQVKFGIHVEILSSIWI